MEVLEPALVADHFTAVMKNQRDREAAVQRSRDLKLNKFMSQMLHKADAAARAREQHAEGQLKCPKPYVLIKPKGARGPRRFFDRFQFRQVYVLHFLCAHDQSKVGSGIVLKRNAAWVKTIAPALATSLFLIRIFVRLTLGIPMDLPEWCTRLAAGGLIDEDGLRTISQELDEQIDSLERLLKKFEQDPTSMDWNVVVDMSPTAYRTISKVAEEHPEWRKEMRFCENRNGLGAWVKKENTDQWRARLD